jgi:phosphoribosylamine--glycine ligase
LFCQQVLAEHGVKTVPIHCFDQRDDAIRFVQLNPGRWVLKQNGQADSTFCYVGKLDDGRDVLDLLEYFDRNTPQDTSHFILQQHIEGVEIGVGRYFNGFDWLGPVEINFEHKHLFPGGIGPKTYEMGTLMWYDPDDGNRLFREVLAPLAPYLRSINFRGDFEINCMVNGHGAFPLEATSRFGYPAVQLQTEFHQSPWGEFLNAVARGEEYQLEWQAGYGIVALIALPPFPFYQHVVREHPLPAGLQIHFRNRLDEGELRHFHPEEVTALRDAQGREEWRTCSDKGYIMHVSALGATVEEARDLVCRRIGNIVIPKMFYRSDIGVRFLERDRGLLETWGYLQGVGSTRV